MYNYYESEWLPFKGHPNSAGVESGYVCGGLAQDVWEVLSRR